MSTDDTAPDQSPRLADTTGSSLPPAPSFDIAPEDQALAAEIAGFDPLTDAPSPVMWVGGSQRPMPDKLDIRMLSPEARTAIQQQLANVPQLTREKREQELILNHLREKAVQTRALAGPGEGANDFQRERFNIAAERHRAEKEIFRLTEQLAEVIRWEPVLDDTGKQVVDPQTGQPKVTPVEAVQGDRRRGMERAIADLEHKINLLDGPEGDLRERRALHAAVEAEKARKAQAEELREAQARGDQMAREERINRIAEARAKGQRHSL